MNARDTIIFIYVQVVTLMVGLIFSFDWILVLAPLWAFLLQYAIGAIIWLWLYLVKKKYGKPGRKS